MRISGDGLADWGGQLRRFRRLRSLKQTALAELIGVDQATISRWESGRQNPDLAMQHRLRDLMRRIEPREEILLKHWINASVGYTVLCDEDRIIRAASPSYCSIHGLSSADVLGLSSIPVFTAELERALWLAIDRGFFEGEVASATVVGRANALSGQSLDIPGMSVWTPVPLTDGRVLRRVDRIALSEEQFGTARTENGGLVRIVMMADLVKP
jgi:transcriptional regulator with XRE-family HTH domain